MATPQKPTTHQADLAKLPPALQPLIERPQWAIWRWTQRPDGTWQKPPFQAMQPDRHASTSDPSTWAKYEAVLDAAETRCADGITYVLTAEDRLAALDLDHCRDSTTGSIDSWAQLFLQRGRGAYAEITPSGEGLRIWGLADGATVNRSFTLVIDGKEIKVELFRRTNKALTITGLELGERIGELSNVDALIDWAVIWGERRKAAAAPVVAPVKGNGKGNGGGNGSSYGVDEIEEFVRSGAPAGKNRSDLFHTIVGHYSGCGWDAERIFAHLQQFPDGIGSKYIGEGRLSGEIARSISKYADAALPQHDVDGWVNGWEARAPQPERHDEGDGKQPNEQPDHEEHDEDDGDLPWAEPGKDDESSERASDLPPLYMHGDPDPRPLKSWLVKRLIPAEGHGLLSGQWGTGKTFAALDLAAAVCTGQRFLDHAIKRQSGVLLIAAEGANEVRLRLDAVIREKCGEMRRAPFVWYETAPMLLHKGSAEKLIAMVRQAEAALQKEHGLPLGLVVIDTITACAGYAKAGEENDPAAGQALMNAFKVVAQAANCFVLGVDHFGKDLERGTRGASSKESSADVVLACLGTKELSGSVVNARLAVRKARGGRQGQQFPFVLREVETPEPDEDGEPITTMVVDWSPPGAAGEARREPDPWEQCRRQDQRTAALRLKRVLMAELAEHGIDLPIPPDGPTVRMVDQRTVRAQFYLHTAAEGTPEQKGEFRRKRFNRAVDWAEEERLITVEEIDGITYLRLSHPDPEGADEELEE